MSVRRSTRSPTACSGAQGKIQVDLRLLDYKPHEGVQFPRKLSGRVTVAGQEMEFAIRITDVQHNEPLEDARFAKPPA